MAHLVTIEMAKKSTSYLETERATVSLGYIGLYEAAAFFGPAWEIIRKPRPLRK